MLHCLRAVTRQRRPRAPLAFQGLNQDTRPVHFAYLVMESDPYAH